MALFSEHGAHCSNPYCRQQDFLPITCDLCKAIVCREHVKYEDHDCPHKDKKNVRVMICPCCDAGVRPCDNEDSDLTLAKHMETDECRSAAKAKQENTQKTRCPVKGCKAKLTFSGSVTCEICHQKVCLKHRFEDAHSCRPCGRSCGQESLESGVAGLLGLKSVPGHGSQFSRLLQGF